MAPIFQDAQIPMISPNTSHPDFFEIGNMMMPLSARSDNCFEEVADVIVEDYSPKSVVMIYQNNDSGVTIDDVFKYQFPKHGVTYASETFVGGETNDFTPIITSLVTKYNPDILIVCSDYSYGSQIVIQAKQLNVKAQLVGIQSMFKPQVASLTGEYGEDLVLCGVQRIYTPEVIENNDYGAYCEDIIARYTEKYPGVQFDSPAALAYDAVMLACDAAAHVGTNNPVALVEYMKELNIDLCSGDAWFDENGDFFRSVYKYVIKNGEFVVID
jgi:branched-chain amino acid transport system substrate-binding protein